jgi:hypothetical protein
MLGEVGLWMLVAWAEIGVGGGHEAHTFEGASETPAISAAHQAFLTPHMNTSMSNPSPFRIHIWL